MQSAVLHNKKYTYADYLQIDDEKRYELIEGELVMVPAPNTRHQEISWKLEFLLSKFIMEKHLGKIFHAPTDVVFSSNMVFQPDVLSISKERLNIIEEQAIMGTPDLVVEIVSRASSFHDTVKKRDIYQKHGVKEYWLVFPDEKAIEVMALEGTVYSGLSSAKESGKVRSKVLEGLEIDVAEVFA